MVMNPLGLRVFPYLTKRQLCESPIQKRGWSNCVALYVKIADKSNPSNLQESPGRGSTTFQKVHNLP